MFAISYSDIVHLLRYTSASVYIRFGFENCEKESKKVLSVSTTMCGQEVCEEEPVETRLIRRRRCGRIYKDDDEEETTKRRCRTCCKIDENNDLLQQECCSNQTTISGRGREEEGEPDALESLIGMKK